jgi:arginyl-tRNA synthetase
VSRAAAVVDAAAAAADASVAAVGRIRVRHTRGCPASVDPYLETVTADDLTALIGPSAARYALVRQARNPAAPIDIGRWLRQTDDNPIFAVQFAHARLAAFQRYAAALAGPSGSPERSANDARTEPNPRTDPNPPTAVADPAWAGPTAALCRALDEYPTVLAHAAERRQPHRLTRYLERLAVLVRDYLCVVRVLPGPWPTGGDPDPADRFQVVARARHILADGLGVLGVSAPERM